MRACARERVSVFEGKSVCVKKGERECVCEKEGARSERERV